MCMPCKRNRVRVAGFFLFTAFLCFLVSCSSVKKIKQQNLSKIYKRGISSINPDFVVYNESDSTTRIFFRISTRELLYSKKEDEENFMAKVMIRYKLLESYESAAIIDSATSYVSDFCHESDCSSRNGRSDIVGDFSLRTILQKNLLLEIITTDVYRNQSHATYLNVNRANPLGSQSFLVTEPTTGFPVFRMHLKNNEKVLIRFRDPSQGTVKCRFYNREFPVAPPPFSVFEPQPFDYQADSIFNLEPDSSGNSVFMMPQKGLYHFQVESAGRDGLTLINCGENFPDIGSPDELILPLRYITTKKEFSGLTSSLSKKEEVDKFWLGIGSSPERARELIRQYYNRVQDANRFFTSYVEGWKTDRGMVYIVFGSPNVIYKNSESESWVYGEENNFMSISFNFFKVSNPFSDQDFHLERSPIYKTNYFKAVDSWREGRVFSTN